MGWVGPLNAPLLRASTVLIQLLEYPIPLCSSPCICEFVLVYLTVGNISFDVLGPWAFQKYSILRFHKVFRVWWRTNNWVNHEQVCSWNSEQSRLLQLLLIFLLLYRHHYLCSNRCLFRASVHVGRFIYTHTLHTAQNWPKVTQNPFFSAWRLVSWVLYKIA